MNKEETNKEWNSNPKYRAKVMHEFEEKHHIRFGRMDYEIIVNKE